MELNQKFGNKENPLHYDLRDAAVMILRIQFMHNLKAADVKIQIPKKFSFEAWALKLNVVFCQLAEGKVAGIRSGVTLQSNQCRYIGLVAKVRRKYTLAVDWLVEATRLARIDALADVTTINTELVETIKEVSRLVCGIYFKLDFGVRNQSFSTTSYIRVKKPRIPTSLRGRWNH